MNPRVTSNSGIYHVIIRGVNRCPIFIDEIDYKTFLKYLMECRKQFHFLIYCYCLMNNHVHLLIHDRENSLSKIMGTLNAKYAAYFNAKSQRVGHLFQGRFRSKPVETHEYFYALVRYIILNPEKAFDISPSEYPWSSYRDYVSGFPTTDTQTVLAESGGIDGFLKLLENGGSPVPIDYEIEGAVPNEAVCEYVLKETGVDIDKIRELKKERRNEVIRALKASDVSNSQLARLTGISRSTIYHI